MSRLRGTYLLLYIETGLDICKASTFHCTLVIAENTVDYDLSYIKCLLKLVFYEIIKIKFGHCKDFNYSISQCEDYLVFCDYYIHYVFLLFIFNCYNKILSFSATNLHMIIRLIMYKFMTLGHIYQFNSHHYIFSLCFSITTYIHFFISFILFILGWINFIYVIEIVCFLSLCFSHCTRNTLNLYELIIIDN